MWLVWSSADDICNLFKNKEDAIKEYERAKKWHEDMFDGEFDGDEHVVLAKVEKNFYSGDTGEPVVDYDEDGNEYEKDDETYWGWHEDTY